MSLANKYRPQTFDQMIGQEHIIDILKAQMQSRDSVHHNYLLFGPRGTGKTTTARLIAKGLNCLNLQNGNPCNQCSNCQLINEATSLDYTEIDAASHTGVDNIREEIIDKALYPPTALLKKIYVIDEVHMLSKGAFNALLKTIEEPKSNVCFILATTEIHKVPDTIISRCQVFNYRKVVASAMVQHLQHIITAENLTAEPAALEIIANISEGHVRDAVKYIDQVSILWAINEENITKFLGVAGESTIKEFLQYLSAHQREPAFELLDRVHQSGVNLSEFAKQLITYIDQHLHESLDQYLEIGKYVGEILSMIRWYPYPIMAYKIVLNPYFTQQATTTPVQSAASVSPAPSPEKKAEKPDLTTKVSPSPEVAPAPAVAPESADADSITSAASESSENKPTAPASASASATGDYQQLWQSIITQLNKPTVETNLKDGAIIETIQGWEVEVIVITPIAKMLLNNEEHKKIIIKYLTQHLWTPVSLKITSESKEDYFARKVGI